MVTISPDSASSSRTTTATSRYPSRRHHDAPPAEGRPKRKKHGQEASPEGSNPHDELDVSHESKNPVDASGDPEVSEAVSNTSMQEDAPSGFTADAGDSATEDGEEIDNNIANTQFGEYQDVQRPVNQERTADDPMQQPEAARSLHGSSEVDPPVPPTADAAHTEERQPVATDSDRLPRVVVQTPQPGPVRLVVIENPGWVPDDVMPRLQVIATRDKPEKHRFALFRVDPTETVFGGYDGSLLCWKQKALTVLFLGRVRSTYFTTGVNNEPARCASVKFKFLSEADQGMARLLVHAKAQPPIVTSKRTFWTGQKATYWSKTSNSIQARYFSELYDGTTQIRAKHLMVKLPNYELRSNDIALFECQIQRYAEKGQRRNTWNSWGANFKLLNITKVFSAPAHVAEEEESEDELVQRVDTDDEDEAY
ncbi:hypothetical protein NM688_g577 [Phlebia brevispora]|uniref:Uncharacterized protein n=1 Tax=Phlebia brevispora TaxID=194682 RepID=A0ACC1TE36_9APHY|nr:hypothetical protein NM688_g577 [Phlebia brevispora]